MVRDDWRRDNVNTLIRRLNTEIHIAKPWVKFSVAPFGIYRPGHPQGMPSPIAGNYGVRYATSSKSTDVEFVLYRIGSIY